MNGPVRGGRSGRLLCAATADELPDGNDWSRGSGRLVDVAVRAALLTDADVRIVDLAAARFDDGIAGLCRYRNAHETGA